MEQQLPTYFLFLIPIAVFVLAQLIKFTRLSLKYGMGLEYLFNPGHMPSAHTAAVTALVITIAYFDSISSSAFIVAAIFSFIVINDALRIRMQVSNQAKQLNVIAEKLDLNRSEFPRLSEHVGHYGKEVASGIFTGIILTTIIIWIFTLFS